MRPFTTARVWRPVGHHGVPAILARRLTTIRSREIRVRRVRGLIAALILLALLGAGWLADTSNVLVKMRDGTVAAFGTKPPTDQPRTSTAGRLVYELPDGESCTYIPFDNVTEWVGEPTTTMCESVARKLRTSKTTDFSWGR